MIVKLLTVETLLFYNMRINLMMDRLRIKVTYGVKNMNAVYIDNGAMFMNREEYIKKMKEYGWTDETINRLVQAYDDDAKGEVIIPFNAFHPEPPIEY